MTDKMTILFVKHTGHVFAAITRNADPSGGITAKSLAGERLLVRGLPPPHDKKQFEIPADQLDVLIVDLDPALLLQPSEFIVDQGRPVPVPGSTVSTVTLTTTDVAVTLNAQVQGETKVWIQVEGETLTKPRVATGSIPSNTLSATFPIELIGSGGYRVLALVAGRTIKVSDATLT